MSILETTGKRPIVWVHGDGLRPSNPALAAYPGAPSVFCWDDELLTRWRISLKRVLFIYECLLELPVVIRRGDVAEQIVAFAREHGADDVATSFSPSPRFDRIRNEIERSLSVQVLAEEPFIDYSGDFDLRRFHRFWRRAEAYAYGGKANE
jgi:hypothetical protein